MPGEKTTKKKSSQTPPGDSHGDGDDPDGDSRQPECDEDDNEADELVITQGEGLTGAMLLAAIKKSTRIN